MEKYFTKRWIVIFLAIFCNILWGSAFPFVKIGYRQFQIGNATADQILFAGIRFTIAGFLLLFVSCMKNHKFPTIQKKNISNVFAMAMIQTTIEYSFFYIGLSNTAASNGSIVNSCSVFWGVLLAHFAYQDDKLTWNKAMGCMVGFLGVILVTIGENALHFAWNGEGFIILASLAFAVGGMFGKKASSREDTIVVTGYNLLGGGIVLLLFGLCLGGTLPTVTFAGILVLMYLAVLSAMAFSLWTLLLKYNPIGSISFFNFVIPVSGTILSAIFLGENILKWNYAMALLLVTLGIFLIQKRNRHGNKEIQS